jgi:hypothetical protein
MSKGGPRLSGRAGKNGCVIGMEIIANRLDFAKSFGTVVISPGNAMIFFAAHRRYSAVRNGEICIQSASFCPATLLS